MTNSESQIYEDKQSLNQWREAVESVAAFATSKGGTVRIGISPTGERIGIQIGKGTLEDIANKIKLNTDPPQFPSITFTDSEKSAVIVIHVEESPLKPVWAFGRPLKRVGRTNQLISREEVHKMMEVTTGRTWDALPCREALSGDMDSAAVKDFLQHAGLKQTPLPTLLKNMALTTQEDIPCNGAVLLFAKNPQRFFPEAQVKCARFAGTTSVKFLDEKTFDGSLLGQLDNAIAFVSRNTQQEIRITGKAERDIVPEYPEEAVREAIVNAICHRDYSAVGTVQVRIYDNRLEIWNPGGLPSDLTIEKLYTEHPSRPHNPRIAQALYRARVIEHWGTGTLRMIDVCKSHNIKLEFISESGVFKACFNKIAQIKKAPDRSSEAQSGAQLTTQSATQSTDPVTRLLNCLAQGAMSAGELRLALKIKHRPTFRANYLHPALAEGLIEYTHPDKPNSRLQKYRLTRAGRDFMGKAGSL